MPEKKMPVRTVQVNYQCDAAGCDGYMSPTGTANLSYPPRYPHRCSKCGSEESFKARYPVIRYEPIEELALEAT
jgi:hypothetical protein